MRLSTARGLLLSALFLPVLTGCNFPLAPLGPEPHPTVIIITATGPYTDTFDTTEAAWLVGNTEGSEGTIADSEYHLIVKKPNWMAWTQNSRVFGDGVYEVDTRFVTGPESSAYGLIMLGSSDLSSFVYVVITDDGRYDIGRCDSWCNKQESLIGGLTLSYSIVPGEQKNHLRVELAGGSLRLLINGAPVSQLQGVTPSSGIVGFIGESSQYGGFEAAFDNLAIIETSTGVPTPTESPPQPTPTNPPLIEPSPLPETATP